MMDDNFKLDFFKTQSPILFEREVLGIDLQPFHIEWLEFIQQNRFTIILAPRGSGKSTVMTVGYTTWKALIDRNIRILIVSNTQRQAEIFLRQIRAYLESTQILDMFGDIKGNIWSTSELDLRGHGVQKEATITSLGVGGALIGRHVDMIILDDIVDEENSRTSYQRENVWEWYFKTLLPMLEPNGEIHIIGTRWHEDDFYSQIMKSDYQTKIYKAILPNGTSYWEDRFPISLLQEIQKQNPQIFAMQYQNEIISTKDAIFKEEYFKYYEFLPPSVTYYQGIDLAASKKGDYFAIVTLAKDNETGNMYVVDTYRGHLSLSKQIDKIMAKYEKYKPVMIGIESNAFQLALANEIKNVGLPVKTVHQGADKISRANRLSIYFENGQIFFNKRNTELINELRLFPRAAHDDLFDALEIAVSISVKRPQFVDLNKRIWTGSYIRRV